jgi:uncharacterized protein YdbL (DUF1318 family)
MRKGAFYILVVGLSVVLYSCFSITVNVYFPAKDVKSAFKTLENDLMKGGAPVETPQAPDQDVPGKPEPKPQSMIRFDIGVSTAYAQDAGELSESLSEYLKQDPDVVKAYGEMGGRLDYINRLRGQGTVGEGNDGLLKPRGDLGKKETAAMNEENTNRKAIIRAMAKAIVMVNGQTATNAAIDQVLDKAASQFAAVRADSAKPGWWVQKADGSWAKK